MLHHFLLVTILPLYINYITNPYVNISQPFQLANICIYIYIFYYYYTQIAFKQLPTYFVHTSPLTKPHSPHISRYIYIYIIYTYIYSYILIRVVVATPSSSLHFTSPSPPVCLITHSRHTLENILNLFYSYYLVKPISFIPTLYIYIYIYVYLFDLLLLLFGSIQTNYNVLYTTPLLPWHIHPHHDL